MKSVFLSSLVLSFFLTSTQYSLAQSTSTEPTSETATSAAEITPVTERPAARQTELDARTQERITNLAANLSNRFDVVLLRLNNILTRLDSRIAKLENEGQNVDEVKNYLATARTALSQAKANITDIDNQVAMLVGATEPRTEWLKVRSTYTNSRELIRSAHADMSTAILVLKREPSVESSPETVENSN